MIFASHVTTVTDVKKVLKQTKIIKRIMKRGDVVSIKLPYYNLHISWLQLILEQRSSIGF